VLSVKEPWASLIINGHKNIENRSWKTNQEWILIHSTSIYDKNMKNVKNIHNINLKNMNIPSHILGIIHIKNIETDCDIDKYKWATGPNCWHIDFVYKFEKPIEAKGQLGLWSPSDNQIKSIKKQLKRDFFIMYGIYKFCNTMNTLYLPDSRVIKKYIEDIYTEYYNKTPNKLALEIMNNFYNYKKAIIKPSYPNPWENTKGFIATPIYLKGADKFEDQLLVGATKWFQSYIPDEYKKLKTYDLTDRKTLQNIFDLKWKKDNLSPDEQKILRKAIDGGGNAQFQPYKGWRKSGFGIWSHIRGSKFIYKEVLPNVLEVYSTVYKGSIKSKSIPHIIYKPPSKIDGKLEAHNDHGTWNDMYTRCLQCDTVEKWVINYGIQSLVHIKGARKKDGGQTTILGPMDTHIYLIILQLIHPKTPHPSLPIPKNGWNDEWIQASGPKFFKWYNPNVLKIINRILTILKFDKDVTDKNDKKWINLIKDNDYFEMISKRAKLSNFEKSRGIKKIKMLPDKDFDSSYLILWPAGFIHGSDSTGITPRLTVTIPYSSNGDKIKSKRAVKRLENLSKGNLKEVLKDKEPYEGGIVHKSTKTEVEIFPYFKDVYLKENDMKYVRRVYDI
jgi:hypothetical protein